MFVDEVRKVWGNPKKVADAGLNETFRHEDAFDFDHGDQVNNARDIGILAGQTADKGPEAFITAFTQLLNED
jgi:hypothetical protein